MTDLVKALVPARGVSAAETGKTSPQDGKGRQFADLFASMGAEASAETPVTGGQNEPPAAVAPTMTEPARSPQPDQAGPAQATHDVLREVAELVAALSPDDAAEPKEGSGLAQGKSDASVDAGADDAQSVPAVDGGNADRALAVLQVALAPLAQARGDAFPQRAGSPGQQAPAQATSGAASCPPVDDAGEAGFDPMPVTLRVVSRETHFRPVADGLVEKRAQPGPTQSAASIEGAVGAEEAAIDASRPFAEAPGAPVVILPEGGPAAARMKLLGVAIEDRVGPPVTAAPRPVLKEMLSPAFSLGARASDVAVRQLTIQLKPAELGVVNVSLKLEGDVLEVRMHVASEAAAAALNSDRDALVAHLRAAGYRPEVISIQTQPVAATQDGVLFSHGQGGDGPQQGNPESGRQGQPHSPQQDASHDEAQHTGETDGRRIAGGVYL